MPYKCRYIIFFILVIQKSVTFGQEMLGTVLGNWSGVNSSQLNPSAMLNSRQFLDINFLGADLFLQNNYLYQARSDYKFIHFFQGGYQYPTHAEDYGTEARAFYNYSDHRLRNGFLNIRINGPGAMLIWGKHAFAITTALRNVFSVHNAPYEVANFAYLGLNYVPQHNINYRDKKPFNSAEMTWAELGVSYGYEVYSRGFNKIAIGISLRRLWGFAGFYLKAYNADYIVPNDSTINAKNIDAEFGLALPISYTDNSYLGSPLVKGGGFSGDIGITYYRLKKPHESDYFMKLCEQRYVDYLYRIGISLIDIGAIRFTSNSVKYSIDNKGSYWDNVNQIHFHDIQHFLDTLSYQFYGTNNGAYRDNNFYVWLPSAVSVQFDYHYDKQWYLNASILYGFNFSLNSLRRPSQIAITPRYETDWFEVNLPVSLYDWYLPRIGLSLRCYNVTIGTEKLGAFFNANDFTGMDFYIAIKYTLDKGNCRSAKTKGCREKDFRVKSKY
ncbi:MAG: DUF5723 family protein [Bacteroidetes bacterium]|nr:DUF5723 family protein [Bacteroidota bacterium]